MAQTLDTLGLDINMNVSGLAGVQQVQTRMQGLDRQIRDSTRAVNQFGGSLTGNSRSLRRWAMGALQQAGYQVGDFYVQVANGTNRMQAFGQQGAQLLGIFGPIGAVLGAGVSIFAAYSVAAQRAEEASAGTAEQVENLISTLERLENIRGIGSDIISAELPAGFAALADFLETGIASELTAGLDAVRNSFLGPLEAAIGQSQSRVEGYRRQIELFEQTLSNLSSIEGQSADSIEELRVALDGVRRNYIEQLQLLSSQRRVWTILQEVAGDTREEFVESFATAIRRLQTEQALSDELRAQLFQFAQANGLVAELARLIGGAGDEAEDLAQVDIATPISNAVSQARELARRLGVSVSLARRIAATAGAGAGSEVLDPRSPNYNAAAAAEAERQAQLAAIRASFENASTSVSQTGGGAAQAIETYQSLIEQMTREAEARRELLGLSEEMQNIREIELQLLGRVQGEVDAVTAAEIRGAAERIAALNAQNEQLERIRTQQEQLAQTIGQSFGTAITSIINGTQSAGDAFRQMAQRIIAELFEVLVVQRMVASLTQAIGGGGGGGFLGALLGVPGKAIGGPITGGRPYMVGERGPELVVPSRNGTVIPNNQLGGGQPVQVVYNFQGGVTEADLGRALPVLVERTKREVVEAVQRGGSVARVFA